MGMGEFIALLEQSESVAEALECLEDEAPKVEKLRQTGEVIDFLTERRKRRAGICKREVIE